MSLVEYIQEGAVALVRLNRPPVNALSEALAVELLEGFRRAADPSVRALVVTGQPHFAAGADIKGFQSTYESGGNERIAGSLVNAIQALEGLGKPTIAAVHGYALGGGLELSMGADFRYLAEDAQVGQPEIKLGLIPGAGGTQRLGRIVGYQKAKELVYTGRHMGAEEALQLGLADRVVPTEQVLEQAMSDAAAWAEGPTLGYAAAKRAINDGWGRPLGAALEIESAAFNDCFWTEDAREGVDAFIGKRPPSFNGR
jgi:enoyl-CoA hydratase/carnithine racemase